MAEDVIGSLVKDSWIDTCQSDEEDQEDSQRKLSISENSAVQIERKRKINRSSDTPEEHKMFVTEIEQAE